jgi:hypothetical protein
MLIAALDASIDASTEPQDSDVNAWITAAKALSGAFAQGCVQAVHPALQLDQLMPWQTDATDAHPTDGLTCILGTMMRPVLETDVLTSLLVSCLHSRGCKISGKSDITGLLPSGG